MKVVVAQAGVVGVAAAAVVGVPAVDVHTPLYGMGIWQSSGLQAVDTGFWRRSLSKMCH